MTWLLCSTGWYDGPMPGRSVHFTHSQPNKRSSTPANAANCNHSREHQNKSLNPLQ
jgi:hypothetical protein